MRECYTIWGIADDGKEYAVATYEQLREAKKHYSKLDEWLKGDRSSVCAYDKSGKVAQKYIVTSSVLFASFNGFNWFHEVTN